MRQIDGSDTMKHSQRVTIRELGVLLQKALANGTMDALTADYIWESDALAFIAAVENARADNDDEPEDEQGDPPPEGSSF